MLLRPGDTYWDFIIGAIYMFVGIQIGSQREDEIT